MHLLIIHSSLVKAHLPPSSLQLTATNIFQNALPFPFAFKTFLKPYEGLFMEIDNFNLILHLKGYL